MSRVFLTGDTHGTVDFSKLNTKNFPIQKELTKEDVVIILGDAGICWDGGKEDKWLQEWYENKNFTTFIVGGNHENYDLISRLLVAKKFNGNVYQVSDSVFFEIRGEIYTFNNKTFLSFGGADSTDIGWRQKGISWWEEEAITQEQVNMVMEKLNQYNNKVDYLFTHTGGLEVCRTLGFKPTQSDVMLDKVLRKVEYKNHYCGHYHVDKIINERTRILYDDIIEI